MTYAITATVTDAAGSVLPGKKVTATVVDTSNRPVKATSDETRVLPVTATTDTDGFATLDLIPNADIAPAGTRYRVTTLTGLEWFIDVTGTGTIDDVDVSNENRARPWLPELVNLQAPGGYTLTQPSHAAPTTEAGLWGGPSEGWWIDDGTDIKASFRTIFGTLVDAAWDPGSGYLGITLPKPPHQSAKITGDGWLFGISAGFSTIAKASGAWFIDPPITDDAVAIFSPDGLTSWATVDPEHDPPPGYALMPNYPVPSTGVVFVVGGSFTYRKAA